MNLDTKVTGNLKDLLEKLLEKNPSQRIGYSNGAVEIKEHPWFKNFPWEKLIKRELEAPFVPLLNKE